MSSSTIPTAVDHALEDPDALAEDMSSDNDIPTGEGYTKSSGDDTSDPTRVNDVNDEEFAYHIVDECTKSSGDDNDTAKGVTGIPKKCTRRRVPDEFLKEKGVNQCYVEERPTNENIRDWYHSSNTAVVQLRGHAAAAGGAASQHTAGSQLSRKPHLVGLIKVHDARKQIHAILPSCILSVTDMLLESMNISATNGEITIMCVKDRGGGNKECKRRISLDSFIKTLVWHTNPKNEPEEKCREDCSSLISRLKGAAMTLKLVDCRENRHDRGRALFAICPRPACQHAEGFEIDGTLLNTGWTPPRVRIGPNTIRCPIEGCITNGEQTWWCSMCETVHIPGIYCPPPDPRKRMTPDELAQHQAMVDAGEEQWCRCGTPYGKDAGCASVTCKNTYCKYHFCFGCGGELDETYVTSHLMNGPDINGDNFIWGCCKTFVNRALKEHTGIRDFIADSLSCPNLRIAIRNVVNDPNVQITGEPLEWINKIIEIIELRWTT